MTIADSSLPDVSGHHASKLGAGPAKNMESDQVVVLVRLPYLVPASSYTQNKGTRSTRKGATPETGMSTPSSPPALEGSSEGVEESESRLPRLLAGFSTRVADSRRYLVGVWVSPLIWKATGFAAAVVLILSAVLLLRGGPPSGRGLANRDQREVPFSIVPLTGEPIHDSGPMLGSETTPSVADETVAMREQPAAEAASKSSEEEATEDEAVEDEATGKKEATEEEPVEEEPVEEEPVEEEPVEEEPVEVEAEEAIEEEAVEQEPPELEPMVRPEVPEVAEVDREALEEATPEQVDSLTRPEADPEPLTSSGVVSAQSAKDGFREAQAQTNPDLPDYPTTNPSVYQYPSYYEQLLINAVHGFHEESYPSSSPSSNPSTSIYRWQPNTVRLQPRIEPPPIR